MRKWRIYLDTSVINFLFADDAQAHRAITVEFFDQRLERFEVFISDVVLFEIGKTQDPEKKAALFEAVRKYNLNLMSCSVGILDTWRIFRSRCRSMP